MKPFQWAGRGQEALLEGREDRKSLPESWEGLGGPRELGDLQEGREGLRVPSGETGGVGRTGRVWEDLPDGRERPRDPSERGRRSLEALSEGREELGGTSRELGGVEKVWRGWEACLESRDGSGGQSEWLGKF